MSQVLCLNILAAADTFRFLDFKELFIWMESFGLSIKFMKNTWAAGLCPFDLAT